MTIVSYMCQCFVFFQLLGKFCSVDSALNDDVTDAMDILDKLPSDNQFRNPSLKFKVQLCNINNCYQCMQPVLAE